MANTRLKYEYLVPGTTEEALELLGRYGDKSKVISGGTDIIPKIKAGIRPFDYLISLKKIGELRYIDFDGNTGIRIGSMMTLRECEANEDIQKNYPALWQGMHSMANTQVRNRGTIAGNICNAIPSADTAPALLVYGAQIKVRSAAGDRVIPIEEFFTGVGRTSLKPEELVTEISIPAPEKNSSSVYFKYAIRRALDLAMVGVASYVTLGADGAVETARIALGAVAPVPKRAEKAEAFITGKKLTEEIIEEAARIASEEDCAPISDIRATAEYRKKMVYVHVRDALRKAVA